MILVIGSLYHIISNKNEIDEFYELFTRLKQNIKGLILIGVGTLAWGCPHQPSRKVMSFDNRHPHSLEAAWAGWRGNLWAGHAEISHPLQQLQSTLWKVAGLEVTDAQHLDAAEREIVMDPNS